MTVKIIRAYDVDDNNHVFSVIAWDKGFTYAHPTKAETFDSKTMVKSLMSRLKPDLKLDVDDYLKIATAQLPRFKYGKVIEDEMSEKVALRSEQALLDKLRTKSQSLNVNQRLVDTNEDMQQVLSDYPELYDQLADGTVEVTADGMLELVMAALGSIDPEGPNKWLLDYMDGKGLPEGGIPQIVFDQTTPEETGK